MRIEHLHVQHFRNITDAAVQPAGLTVFLGDNGQGKTNLLEAIYFLQTLTSFRGERRAGLIQHKKPASLLQQSADLDGRKVKAVVSIEPTAIGALVDHTRLKSTAEYRRHFPAVYFAPENLEIVDQSPTLRRNYFDGLFAAVDREYETYLKAYRKAVLTRRVCILQNKTDLLSVANSAVASAGEQLFRRKVALVRDLLKFWMPVFPKPLFMRLKPSVDPKGGYTKELLARIANIPTPALPAGPHKDDYVFYVTNEPAKGYASRGEKRQLVLTLKMAEVAFLESKLERRSDAAGAGRAVLVLDDPFSELDPAAREWLIKAIPSRQTFLSAADPKLLPRDLGVASRRYLVRRGALS
ncbi:MAG: DNA replication/repair protein RecF [bacterium]